MRATSKVLLASALLCAFLLSAGTLWAAPKISAATADPASVAPGGTTKLVCRLDDPEGLVQKVVGIVREAPDYVLAFTKGDDGTWVSTVPIPRGAAPATYHIDLSLTDAGGKPVAPESGSSTVIAITVVGSEVAVPIAVVGGATAPAAGPQEVTLPAPETKGGMSLNEALSRRRSVRGFDAKTLGQQQLGQLLWATQGITDPATGHRTSPSAMAIYPLTVYVCTADGVFTYEPKGHKLVRVSTEDRRAEVTQPPRGGQPAPVSFVFTGDPGKFGSRSPDRAAAFVYLEVGHAAENLALEATALGLATVPQGGIDAAKVSKALNLPQGTLVVYTMPVGYPVAR